MRRYGDVVGLVYGAVGEASPAVHSLACRCAKAIGRRRFAEGDLSYADEDAAVAAARRQVFSAWGVTAVKRKAACLLSVLDQALVGGGHYAACKRAEHADDMFDRDRLRSATSRLGAVVDRGWDGRLSFYPSPPSPGPPSNSSTGRVLDGPG